jgi:hypothetical protein
MSAVSSSFGPTTFSWTSRRFVSVHHVSYALWSSATTSGFPSMTLRVSLTTRISSNGECALSLRLEHFEKGHSRRDGIVAAVSNRQASHLQVLVPPPPHGYVHTIFENAPRHTAPPGLPKKPCSWYQSLDFNVLSYFFRIFRVFESLLARFTNWLMPAGWPMPSRLASQSFLTEVSPFTTDAQITLRGSLFRSSPSSSFLSGSPNSAPTTRMIRSASLSPWARTAAPATFPGFLLTPMASPMALG